METILNYLEQYTDSRPISIAIVIGVVMTVAAITWYWALHTAEEGDITIGVQDEQLSLSEI